MYTLSIPLRELPNHHFSEGNLKTSVGELQVELCKTNADFRISVSGFDNPDSAKNYVPLLRASLTWALIKNSTAIPRSFDIQQPTLPSGIDPIQASKNVCEAFGMQFDGVVRAGIIDTSAAYIVKSGEKYFELSAGTVGVSIHNKLSTLNGNIYQGLMQVKNDLSDENFLTALDLYQNFFLESSARARFFSLIMCLEVLSTDTPRPKCVVELIEKWKSDLDQIFSQSLAREERDALEALQNMIIHQKNESIRKRIFNFVYKMLCDEGEETAYALARRAREIYDIRSTLTHKGSVEIDKFNIALEDLKSLLERIFLLILLRKPS